MGGDSIEIRFFTGNDRDTQELIDMFLDLEKDNIELPSYAIKVKTLFDFLSMNGSVCFIVEKDSIIVGFAIIYPDSKGGSIGQSLYVKEEYRNTRVFFTLINYLENYIVDKYNYCLLLATNDDICSIYDKRYEKIQTVYKYTKGD